MTSGASQETIVIDDRYEGPPSIANGGYASGLLAERVIGPLEIRLNHPVPVGQPLQLEVGPDGGRLTHNERVLLEARPAQSLGGAMRVVTLEEAAAATKSRSAPVDHPFPNCFGCGPNRSADEGLHLLPAEVAGIDAMACVWTPLPDTVGPEIEVRSRYLGVALDCPTYWPLVHRGEIALLGTLTIDIRAEPTAGEPLVVASWAESRDGRRLTGRAAIYTWEGELVAASRATWIRVDWEKVAAATGVTI